MHRSTTTSSTGGGLFKGVSIFGGSKTPTTSTRPSTSGGYTSSNESAFSSFSSKAPTLQRKASVSALSSKTHRGRTTSTTFNNLSPERRARSSAAQYREAQNLEENPLPAKPVATGETEQPKSADSFEKVVAGAGRVDTPASGTESFSSTTPYVNMLARPGAGYQSSTAVIPPPSPTLETITYQHIQETSSKRISTLDYLRKAYVVVHGSTEMAKGLIGQ